MPKYILHWKDGKDEIVEGPNIAQACMLAGYGGGAILAMDYHEEIEEESEEE
jgi:hypothetical protein